MAAAGLAVRGEWVIPVSNYDCGPGREGIQKLIQMERMPTALLGLNDVIAVGMLQELLACGVKIPEQISVIGFDDTFLTNVMTPQLTAVGYDYDEYAAMLMEVVVAAIEGRDAPRNQLVTPHLFVKKSCAAPSLK